jgi:hypothetical protein
VLEEMGKTNKGRMALTGVPKLPPGSSRRADQARRSPPCRYRREAIPSGHAGDRGLPISLGMALLSTRLAVEQGRHAVREKYVECAKSFAHSEVLRSDQGLHREAVRDSRE